MNLDEKLTTEEMLENLKFTPIREADTGKIVDHEPSVVPSKKWFEVYSRKLRDELIQGFLHEKGSCRCYQPKFYYCLQTGGGRCRKCKKFIGG